MKGGNAAPRDATARPAWEQELQDVDHHPDFRDGPTVIRKIGRWATVLNTGSSAVLGGYETTVWFGA